MDGHKGLISDKSRKKLTDCFADHDVKLLLDEAIDCEGLSLVGLRDYWYGRFNEKRAREVISSVAGTPSIVLSHNPDTVDLPIWDGFDSWVLCGHTHGGQCSFPVIGTPVLPIVNKSYVAGKYEISGGHKMFVTRGIGHTHRLRFMARPEISVLTLRG